MEKNSDTQMGLSAFLKLKYEKEIFNCSSFIMTINPLRSRAQCNKGTFKLRLDLVASRTMLYNDITYRNL